MKSWTFLQVGLALLVAPFGSGCTALRELPRDQYAAKPERRHLVVDAAGERHAFGRATFGADSMVGYPHRRRGAAADTASVRLALDDVSRIVAREVDWYRTSLLGGVALGAVLAATLSGSDTKKPAPEPPPCTRCP